METHTMVKKKTPKKKQPSSNETPAMKRNAGLLQIALQRVESSKNKAVTPTLKRLTGVAQRQLERMQGKKKQR